VCPKGYPHAAIAPELITLHTDTAPPLCAPFVAKGHHPLKIPVNPDDLTTEYPGVYAIGDVADVGTPKAGMFAEGMARIVAENIIADLLGTEAPDIYRSVGTCYVEFGKNLVGRMDVEFMEGPATGTYIQASAELAVEKEGFGASRRARWFGL
jgi:sulfide:quinone oxidoreductase